MSADAIEITRYPNRRLYDRSTGQYVTLQELEERVRQGQNIAVTDSKSGDDLTRAILTQMILERHPERMELFPISFLHLMLRTNDMALDWMRSYLQQIFSHLESLTFPVAAAPPLMPPFDWFKPFLVNWPLPPTPLSPTPPQPVESVGPVPPVDDKEALAGRIEQLESRLRELEAVKDQPPERP